MFGWARKDKEDITDFDQQLLASNLVAATSLKDLECKERRLATIRESELLLNPICLGFDYAHLKAINKHLFQDVYVWAGMDRYDIGIRGDFRKGNTHFTRGLEIPDVAEKLFHALKDENIFCGLKKERFIKSAASFMNGLNILHPFREGNGRTQRIFMEQLATNAGYCLNLSNISQNMMIQAAIQGAKGNLKGYEILIKESITLVPIKLKSRMNKPFQNKNNPLNNTLLK